MKTLGTIFFVAALVLGVAWVAGVFEADVCVDVSIDKQVKKDVKDFTHDTLEKTQKGTNDAFDALKKKIGDR